MAVLLVDFDQGCVLVLLGITLEPPVNKTGLLIWGQHYIACLDSLFDKLFAVCGFLKL